MKKKTFLATLTCLLIGGSTFIHSSIVDAHGYVSSPASRGYQGQLDKSSLDWASAHSQYGRVINEPQSLEGPKGFPQNGPADSRLASVNGVLGDYVLDDAGLNRWKKQDMKTGTNNFTWAYTANHSTAKWHYYMTKPGWNPEKPLTRDSLELIGEITHDGSSSENNKTHQINIPADRSGYHIIYAVWDVADTTNAFYNVIDVNVNGTGSGSENGSCSESENGKPSAPKELHSMKTTANSVDLMWAESSHSSGENSGSGKTTWKPGTSSNPIVYTEGDIVEYKGKKYLVRQTHSNYGDDTWAPDKALSLFIQQ